MQVSRHWRMNSLRYRLEGVRYVAEDTNADATVQVSLEGRPVGVYTATATADNIEVEHEATTDKTAVSAA